MRLSRLATLAGLATAALLGALFIHVLASKAFGFSAPVSMSLAFIAAVTSFWALVRISVWLDAQPPDREPALPSGASRRRLAWAFGIVGVVGACETAVLLTMLFCGRQSPMGSPLAGISGPLSDGFLPGAVWPVVAMAGAIGWCVIVLAAWRWLDAHGGTVRPG